MERPEGDQPDSGRLAEREGYGTSHRSFAGESVGDVREERTAGGDVSNGSGSRGADEKLSPRQGDPQGIGSQLRRDPTQINSTVKYFSARECCM